MADVPLDCKLGWIPLLGAPWAFSQRCREAYDLREAGFKPPTAPPAPPAPETREQMTTWTPGQMLDEYGRQTQDWAKGAIPDAPTPEEPNYLLWIALGLGAVVVIKVVKAL